MLRWIMIEIKRIDKIMIEGVANVSVYFSAVHRYILSLDPDLPSLPIKRKIFCFREFFVNLPPF